MKKILSSLAAWLRRTFTKTKESGNGGTKTVLKTGWKITAILLACLIVLAAIGGTAAALYVRHLQNDAASLFVPTPSPSPSATAEVTAEPTPTPTLSPYEQLQTEADLSMMENIVNVLLIGVDYSEERETWDGKQAFHADVMMLAAINFDTGEVDLISLPRDTYAKIPGVNGKYKLNASIDCGGGWPTEGGFNKVCEAAEWMLGGIPVDYYYAVSMPVVKELVDIIGGVEYEIEMDFSMQGRDYTAGLQYMDGQAVLDYCRVRKDIANEGDEYRVNRQKEIMLALFEAAKDRSIITKIPQIIDSFEGDLYTNCTYEQTAALALFAYHLDAANVSMHSMGGEYYDIYNWGFCITDQYNRVEIIQEVYGVSVEPYEEYSRDYCFCEWADMVCAHYLEITKDMWKVISEAFEADLPLYQASTAPPAADAPAPAAPRFTAEQHEKYEKIKKLYKFMIDEGEWYVDGQDLLGICYDFRKQFPDMAEMFDYDLTDFSWYVYIPMDIYVDFN